MKSGRIALTLVLPLIACAAACGSKTGVLSVGEPVDAAPPDAGDSDAGFDTFPCRWSYGQPLILARGSGPGVWSGLGGAVHGRLDRVWVHGEDLSAGDGRVSQLLGLGDPPRTLDEPAVVSDVSLHGLEDGWTALSSDCSLAFFDDAGRPRRLIVSPPLPPPCWLERLDTRFIDISFEVPGAAAQRYDAEGSLVHELFSELFGTPARTVTSPDGRFTMLFAQEPLGTVSATLADVAAGGPVASPLSVGESIGGLSTSVDRLRPAALALLPGRGTTTLFRLPFDRSDFAPEVFATTSDGALDPDDALVTNETEALMVLSDGRIAIQPLSGSDMRFLEAPELPSGGRIERLKVLLAPGQSRGGILYSYVEETGASFLAFRTLVCNR